MAIAYRATGTRDQSTSGSDLTPILPTGHVADDLLVMTIMDREDVESTFTVTGWTLRAEVFKSRDAGQALKLATYFKIDGGSESDPTISTSGSVTWAAQISAWSGCDTGDPWDIAAGVTDSDDDVQTFAPTGITTLNANAVALSVVLTMDNNSLNFSVSQSFTERYNVESTAGLDHSIAIADKDIASASAVTMPTWNQSANSPDDWAAISDALKVAGGNIIPLIMHHRKMMGAN